MAKGKVFQQAGLPRDTLVAVRRVREPDGNGYAFVVLAEEPIDGVLGLAIAATSLANVPGCPDDLAAVLRRFTADVASAHGRDILEAKLHVVIKDGSDPS